MALQATVKTLKNVPEEMRELYVQHGHVFALDIEGIDDHPAIRGLRDSQRKLLKEKKELQKELDVFRGIDAAVARKADDRRGRELG